MLTALSRLFETIFGLFFPLRCLGCKAEINPPKKVLCINCELNLPLTYFHLIHPSPLKEDLFVNLKVERVFSIYIFEQNALIESLLYQLKYDGNKSIGVFFGQRLAGLIYASKTNYNGIIGVPLHQRRKRKRGFNQVDIIGETTAQMLAIPYYGHLIQRIKNTPKLATATQDRATILHNAFRLNPTVLLPKGHYLLIDDILTTGATLTACSKVIMTLDNISLSIASIVYRN